MIDEVQEPKKWYYEDFCNDLSSWLTIFQRDFCESASNGYSSEIDQDKLAIVLSKFWHATEG